MLSTLLSNLISYFSKYFLVASFLPMLAFWFFSGAMGYLLFKPFHDWATSNVLKASAVHTGFVSSALVLGIIIFALALASVNDSLRGLLEGNWSGPVLGMLRRALIPIEEWRLRRIEAKIEEAAQAQADLDSATIKSWIATLRAASQKGTNEHRDANSFQGNESVVQTLKRFRELRIQSRLSGKKELDDAVTELKGFLEKNDENMTTGKAAELGKCHVQLVQLIQRAGSQAGAEHARWFNQRNSHFGSDLAPTRMGNVANSFLNYAVRRYNCNLEAIWSELQRCIQKKDEKAFAALQDAKAQLDFLVACCWLTFAWSVSWGWFVLAWSPFAFWFGVVALLGPLVAYLWYRAAVEQYRAFAGILTTGLDVFRFDLLQQMRLALPADLEAERVLWDSVNRALTYGESSVNLSYQHPKTP